MEIEDRTLFSYLDTAACLFVVINSDYAVELINQKGCDILGYARHEILGKNWFYHCIPKNEQKKLTFLFDQIIKGIIKPPAIYENWIVTKENNCKLIQWSNSLLKDVDGNVKGIICSGTDITELKKIQKKLDRLPKTLKAKVKYHTQELQDTIKNLVETNLALESQMAITQKAESKMHESRMFLTAIVQKFPRSAIMVFNNSLELIYIDGEELDRMGLKKSEFINHNLSQITIFSNIELAKIKRDVEATLKGELVEDEVSFRGQHYSLQTTPLQTQEKENQRALLVFNNITHQKRLQEKLEAALYAEQNLNELKSRFIAIASHEFRTPLSAILSSAILISKQNETGKEKRRLKHVERIRSNVNYLVVILNDFLSLDKLDEGIIRAKPKSFELFNLVKLVIQEVLPTKKLGQQIQLKHGNTELMLFQDSKLLTHILINLLSNAIKYSEEGQKIFIKIRQQLDRVLITITDKGMGIPQDEQYHLFERFFRASNVINLQGTGLGLHIVKQYTELLGGKITFKSEIGTGSSFQLALPLSLNTP